MKKINPSVDFILEFAKTQAILTRRFDSILGGIGLNEFRILYNLNTSKDEKMRRIDLANKIGLTASGVTRLLLPMEKVGVVKRGENENDARARYVMITESGKLKLEEAVEEMDFFLDELIPQKKKGILKDLTNFISEIGARTYMN